MIELWRRASLLITAHRAGPMLDACLASAARLNPAPLEVIVSVDGASPEVETAVLDHGYTLVSLPLAPGVSSARNAGAAKASGDILIFVDSDVEMPPDFLARAADAFARYPDAAAIIGSYDDAPAAVGLVSQYRNLLHHYTHQHGAAHANTFWAACGAIRRVVFCAVGGFDPNYAVPSVEDIELGYRLRRAANHIRLAPDWQVKHLKRWHFWDLFRTDLMQRALPWSRLIRRESRIDNDLNLSWRSRFSAGLVCVAFGALLLSVRWHAGLVVAVAALGLATTLNFFFYRFLATRQGLGFALLAMPLHWIYFLVGVTGFVLGMAVERTGSRRLTAPR